MPCFPTGHYFLPEEEEKAIAQAISGKAYIRFTEEQVKERNRIRKEKAEEGEECPKEKNWEKRKDTDEGKGQKKKLERESRVREKLELMTEMSEESE